MTSNNINVRQYDQYRSTQNVTLWRKARNCITAYMIIERLDYKLVATRDS
jgi:hypothetical protein